MKLLARVVRVSGQNSVIVNFNSLPNMRYRFVGIKPKEGPMPNCEDLIGKSFLHSSTFINEVKDRLTTLIDSKGD